VFFVEVCFNVEDAKQVQEVQSMHCLHYGYDFWEVTIEYQHLGRMKGHHHELHL